MHAPAAPVRERRMLQLWACLNLRHTGSVCLCVQVQHVLESNCTYAAPCKHQNKLYVACGGIVIRSSFIYHSRHNQPPSSLLSSSGQSGPFANTTHASRQSLFSVCLTCVFLFLRTKMVEMPCIVSCCVPRLRNSHCDQ